MMLRNAAECSMELWSFELLQYLSMHCARTLAVLADLMTWTLCCREAEAELCFSICEKQHT